MNQITPRLRVILLELLEAKDFISIQSLAHHLQISKRTVQRELDHLQHVLKDFSLTFQSKAGLGVKLLGELSNKERLLHVLQENPCEDATNIQERRKKLILEILKEKGLRKLFYYSNVLDVSEATVASDLESVKEWFQQYNLHIQKTPGKGVNVVGSERDYRKAIRVFIEENVGSEIIQNFYHQEQFNSKTLYLLKKSNLSHLINEKIMRQVVHCLQKMSNQHVLTLTENSYMGLILHISIAIQRIKQSESLDDHCITLHKVDDVDYILAEEIVKELEIEFQIKIPQIEVSYIYLHLKGSKKQKIVQVDNENMLGLVNDMINAYDEKEAFYLKQDNEFIQGLLAHLQPTFVRLEHGMRINNPILSEIKKEFPLVFDKCTHVAQVLQQWTGHSVPQEEVGYLAIHFGAASVRLHNKTQERRQVHVGVICASGIGLSRLMMSKLEKTFRNRAKFEALGQADVTTGLSSQYDFFINTMSFSIEGAHVVAVNPLLSEADLETIDQVLSSYERMPKKEQTNNTFTMDLERVNQLALGIKQTIQKMKLCYVEQSVTFEELVDQVSKIVTQDYVDQQVIVQDLMQRERLCSQIFSDFGFALLHARTKGVHQPMFHIVFPEGDVYANPYMQKIDIVFVMLVPDDEKAAVLSQMFGFICSSLIEEPTLLNVCKHANILECKEVVTMHLKRFFTQYIEQF